MSAFIVYKLAAAGLLQFLLILQCLPPNTLSAKAGDKSNDKVMQNTPALLARPYTYQKFEELSSWPQNFAMHAHITAGHHNLGAVNLVRTAQYFRVGSFTATKVVGVSAAVAALIIACDDNMGRQSLRQPWSTADVSSKGHSEQFSMRQCMQGMLCLLHVCVLDCHICYAP